MQKHFPKEVEVIEYFRNHQGFRSAIDIITALIAPHVNRSNPIEDELRHALGILHELKAKGFLLVDGEGKDIYHEKFSSTPDRIKEYDGQVEGVVKNIVNKVVGRKYSKTDTTNNNSQVPIEEYSDGELLSIIRKAENPHVPGSLFQQANNERQIRQSPKTSEAIKNELNKNDWDEIKRGMRDLLNDPQYTKRKFSLFKKRFYGLLDDDLRSALRSIGAMAFFGKENGEQWGLRSRNIDIGNTIEQDTSQPAKKPPFQSINILKSQVHFGEGDNYVQKKVNQSAPGVLEKYWWGLLIPVVVGVVVFYLTQGKPQIDTNISAVLTSSTEKNLATSTVRIEDVLLKNESYDTFMDQKVFLETYKDAIVGGVGSFTNIDKTADVYYVYMQIEKYSVACSFGNIDAQLQRRLLLFKKGDSVSFHGTFTGGNLNGLAWYVSNCTLL